jgi:transposase
MAVSHFNPYETAGKEFLLLSPFFMQTQIFTGIGVDVSKDTLVTTVRSGNETQTITFPNTSNGITALQRKLKNCSCSIVMESTGRYHLLCAFLLSERGYDVRVINPIMAKRFLSASVRKCKTDKADAMGLALMGEIQKDLPQFTANIVDIQIRQKMGLLATLEKKLQGLLQMMKTYRAFQENMGIGTSEAEEQISACIKTLKIEKERLAIEVQELILQDSQKKVLQEIACTIPGISSLTGALLVQMLSLSCTDPKQWVAFFGLDVSQNESGKTKRRGKLSKRGNSFMRKRLFCSGWGAAMNYPPFRLYYDLLKEKGHSHRAAVIIIARKLLRTLFHMLKTGTPFSFESCHFA